MPHPPPTPHTPSPVYKSPRAFPPVPHYDSWCIHLIARFPLARRSGRPQRIQYPCRTHNRPPPQSPSQGCRGRPGYLVKAPTAAAGAVLDAHKGEPETLIHLVAFLKMLVPGLIAREHLNTITTRLLALPKLSNPYLTQAAHSLLTSLLSSKSDDIDVDEARETASYVLDAIVATPPSKQDAQLAPYWLSLLGQASLAASSPTPLSAPGMDLDSSAAPHVDLPKIWNLAFTYLELTPIIRKSAEEALIQLTQCVTPLVPQPPKSLVHTLDRGLTSLAYAPALGNILRTLASFIMAFAAPWSDAVKKSGAQTYFKDVVNKVSEMRVKNGFEHREGADALFSAFARAAGVDGC